MDEVMTQALEPVLRDLRATGAPEPDVLDQTLAHASGVTAYLQSRTDDTGASIQVFAEAAEPQRIVSAANQVQEWVIDRLWPHAPTNWPQCPRHPDNHPMAPGVADGTAMWFCPRDRVPVAPIGGLADE